MLKGGDDEIVRKSAKFMCISYNAVQQYYADDSIKMRMLESLIVNETVRFIEFQKNE
jgi:hypothetical protein